MNSDETSEFFGNSCVAFSVDDDDQLHVYQNLEVSYYLKYNRTPTAQVALTTSVRHCTVDT